MHIQCPEGKKVEEFLGQNLSEGDHYGAFGAKGANRFDYLFRSYPLRLVNGKSQFTGQNFDGRVADPPSPPTGAVGLRDYRAYGRPHSMEPA
jgi:hypothetical protein